MTPKTHALVTGGAQGIGRAIAERLAKESCAVTIADRDGAMAQATAAALRQQGATAFAVRMDVTDPAEVRDAARVAEAELGPVGILMNNAGICPIAPALETTLEQLQMVFRVNFEGTVLVCQAIVPGMVERRQGVVINMSSWTGKWGRPFFAAYSASKFAVLGFTQALAAEVAGKGVRVNAICPGIVVSTSMREQIEQAHEQYGLPGASQRVAAIPLGRAAEPDDISGVAAFLASDDARYVTGEAINVSGGLFMD